MAINKNKVIAAAQKYAEKGAYDKAISEYLKVVKEEPEDVRTWLKVGDLYAKKGARQEATSTYLKVAEFYATQGFYLKAVAVYKQILKLDPTVIKVNLRLAELYQQLGLLSDAQNQYEHVASFNQRAGRMKDALDVMQRLVELDQDNVPSRIKLAELYSKQEMKEEAVREFTVAAERLRDQGRIDDFIKVAERLLWHKPDELGFARELASMYLERGDPKRALAKLQQCFQADPGDVETLALLARAFQTIGQLPKTISVYKEMARIFGEQGNEARRKEVFEAILAIAPDDPEANQALYGGAQVQQPEPAPYPPEDAYAAQEAYAAPPVVQDPYGAPEQPQAAPAPEAYAPPPAEVYEDPSEAFEIDDAFVEEVEELEPSQEIEELVVLDGQQDQAAEISRLMTETDVFVKYGLHDKAIEHLHKIFEIEPVQIEAREKLKDIYVQIGQTGHAVAELIYLSDLYGEANPQGAVYYLQEALAVVPGHPDAMERLQRLGVEVGPDGAAPQDAYADEGYAEYGDGAQYDDGTQYDAEVQHNAGVQQQYDAGAQQYDAGAQQYDAGPQQYDAGAQQYDAGEDIELGSEDIELDQVAAGYGAPPEGVTQQVQGFDESTIETSALEAAAVAEPAPHSKIEEELEEVDFFIQQGLFDEARAMLTEVHKASPDNPIVAEKIAELHAAEQQEEPLLDQSFDLGAQIPEELDGSLVDMPSKERDDVKDVFEQFKKGVAQQVDAGDADTHFDLGVAYKEMGLVDDAIAEFEIARESAEREAIAQTMIGHCFLQNGQTTNAINAFKKGLYAEHKTLREELDLYYELGTAYLALTDPGEALYYFQKVAKRAPDYRDVSAQISAIESGQHAS